MERHRWRAAPAPAAACRRPGCYKAVSVRATQPAQSASRKCSAAYLGKHWQRCSGGNLIRNNDRAQWGSRTSQQACLCTCTCTYVVLYACHPCSAVSVNMKARTTPADYLRGTCRSESCTGCSTAKAWACERENYRVSGRVAAMVGLTYTEVVATSTRC